MLKFLKAKKTQVDKLYNKILILSRNKLFYTKFCLNDTFQNRISLIFLHISFLFIKLKQKNKNELYKAFSQRLFDLIFRKIELNMREIGYGDTFVNDKMKLLLKTFYNILLGCEDYSSKSSKSRYLFLFKYLTLNNDKNCISNIDVVAYFDKYQAFCFDLSSDSVLKGELNFNYK